MMRSSYIQNNYGEILRSLIIANKPNLVIECGILDGYSTLHIAQGLKYNRKRGIPSSFFAYDLFEDYEYNHGDVGEVIKLLRENEVYCSIVHGDAFYYYNLYRDGVVDFLHFDISNDGDILIRMLETWGSKISEDGLIAFEGGTEERDNGWIKKYNKKPIRPELFNNPLVYEKWNIQILNQYPGLTLMRKK